MKKRLNFLIIIISLICFGCASHPVPPDHICRNPRAFFEYKKAQMTKTQVLSPNLPRRELSAYDNSLYNSGADHPVHFPSVRSNQSTSDEVLAVLLLVAVVVIVVIAVDNHNRKIKEEESCLSYLQANGNSHVQIN